MNRLLVLVVPLLLPLASARALTPSPAPFQVQPMRFEANAGQTDPRVQFLVHGRDGVVFLSPGEAVLRLQRKVGHADTQPANAARRPAVKRAVVKLRPLGVDVHARALPLDPLPGRTHYFIGDDPHAWVTDVQGFARVRYERVYPGIDLVYYGHDGHLEYDFVLAPGADPRRIAIAIDGADTMTIDADGDLVLRTPLGEIRQHAPQIYQERDGVRIPRHGRYVRRGARVVGIALAPYDRDRPLVIDPEIVYATYLGGANLDVAHDVKVDADGAAYVAGSTQSTDFPTANGGTGGSGFDAFVTKLSPDGSTIVYTAFFGGDGVSAATGIALDDTKAAYVVGTTSSTDFPKVGAFQPTFGGFQDGFVLKLDPTGATLDYASYLGGTGFEEDLAIKLDVDNHAFVTGDTTSTDFPTVNPIQSTNGGGADAFFSIVSTTGASLLYSSYFGGDGDETQVTCTIDGTNDDLFVRGETTSANFAGPGDPDSNFVLWLRPIPTTPQQSSLGSRIPRESNDVLAAYQLLGPLRDRCVDLSKTKDEVSRCVAKFFILYTHPLGQPLTRVATKVTSQELLTASGAFCAPGKCPIEFRALDRTTLKQNRAFAFGGAGEDHPFAIASAPNGALFITGETTSTDFPTLNPIQAHSGGGVDVFVAAVPADTASLGFSTYFGGNGEDVANGIAVDTQGNVYVVGSTTSTGLATTGAAQTSHQGASFASDAFVLKFGAPTLPTPPPNVKGLLACQKALTKAGSSYAGAKLKALDGCANGVLKCVETTAAGTKHDTCVAKAKTGCGKQLLKIAAAGNKLTAALTKACGGGAVSDTTALATNGGLGYNNVTAECAQFETTLGTVDSVIQCLLRQHACRSEEIFHAQEPRAKELMRIAGVPTADLDALACLFDHGGTGADLGDPKGAGKAVTTCEKAVKKAGSGFVTKKLKSLQACVTAVFTCVSASPSDNSCIPKAHATCDKDFAAIDKAASKLDAAVAKACAAPAIDFAVLSAPAGANLGALAGDCAALGVATLTSAADYATCVFRQHECHAEQLLLFETPRAAELLDMVARPAKSAFCP